MSNIIGIKVIQCEENKNQKQIVNDLLFLDKIDEKHSNLNGFVGWTVFNSIKGNFYEIFSKNRHDMEDDILGANDIVDFVPIRTQDITWLPKLYLKRFHNNQEYIAIIKEEFKEAFVKMIKGLLETSSSRTIALLFQIQEPAKERYYGALSFKKFISLLEERKILHNIVYFIHER